MLHYTVYYELHSNHIAIKPIPFKGAKVLKFKAAHDYAALDHIRHTLAPDEEFKLIHNKTQIRFCRKQIRKKKAKKTEKIPRWEQVLESFLETHPHFTQDMIDKLHKKFQKEVRMKRARQRPLLPGSAQIPSTPTLQPHNPTPNPLQNPT